MGKRSERLIRKIVEQLDSAEKSSAPMRDLICNIRAICREGETRWRKGKDDEYFPIGGNGLLSGMRPSGQGRQR